MRMSLRTFTDHLLSPIWALLCLGVIGTAANAESLQNRPAFIHKKCSPASSLDSGLESSRFEKNDDRGHSDYSVEEMRAFFEDSYSNGKRLSRRVFWDERAKNFITPITEDLKLKVPNQILFAIQSHINHAIQSKNADFVFFSDLGHGHFFVPQQTDLKLALPDLFGKVTAGATTQILYHMAEHLDLRPETRLSQKLEGRFLNRNAVGGADGSVKYVAAPDRTEFHNTLRTIDGHIEVPSFVVYMKAHRDGCFQYKEGKTTRSFDIRF